MYSKHHVFQCPKRNDVKIWRYMDLSKFISLLETRTLYFSRSDQLGDPYEFAVPKSSHLLLDYAGHSFRDKLISNIKPDTSAMMREQKLKRISQIMEEFVSSLKTQLKETGANMYVSCWHLNNSESAAMWKLYLQSAEGIAIQTNMGIFKLVFSAEQQEIFIGKVKYIEYERQSIGTNNTLNFIIHKRTCFAHEKELRAVIWNRDRDKSEIAPLGISVPIDPSVLIERIYVAPIMPRWFFDLIGLIVTRYGLNADVIQSTLFDRPD